MYFFIITVSTLLHHAVNCTGAASCAPGRGDSKTMVVTPCWFHHVSGCRNRWSFSDSANCDVTTASKVRLGKSVAGDIFCFKGFTVLSECRYMKLWYSCECILMMFLCESFSFKNVTPYGYSVTHISGYFTSDMWIQSISVVSLMLPVLKKYTQNKSVK